MKFDVDNVSKSLRDKTCPLHNLPMSETSPFIAGDDYRRDRYKCPHCECRVDFVGDEIKTDSVLDTLEYMALLELACQRVI